jgi:hypothetical protein
MYSRLWRFMEDDGNVLLASKEDIDRGNMRDSGRWLRPIDPGVFSKYLKLNGPFFLHMNSHLLSEQGDGGQTPTAVDQ